MANKWAIQNGNWSDGSTWNDGVVPTVDDDVWLNGKTVVVYNIEAYSKTISNESTNSVVQGGRLQIGNGSSAGIVNSNLIRIIGSTFLEINNGIVNSDITISDMTDNNQQAINFGYNTLSHIINGNISITSLQGVLFYCRAGLLYVNGNIQWNGNCLWSSGIPSFIILGNVYANNGIRRDMGGISELNGSLFIQNYGVTLSTGMVVDEIIIEETFSDNIIFPSGPNNIYIRHLFRNLAQEGRTYLTGTIPDELTFKIGGEFHLGYLIDIGANTSYGGNIGTLICYEGSKLFYSQNQIGTTVRHGGFPYFYRFQIENPSTFEIVYEGEGEPTFEIIPYRGNHRLNYPTEQQVAQGVTYGMQNEYEGRLQLPPEGAVLKDVTYGDKTGTLEVIGLSGATATADNISVVNLTEQQLQRVGNCATVSTVQKCFEEFKE